MLICIIRASLYVCDIGRSWKISSHLPHTPASHKKNTSGGARQAILAIPGQGCFKLISSHKQGIYTSLSSTPPVYIQKVHQNCTNGSAVSELMRFIHHITTHVVLRWPRRAIPSFHSTRTSILPSFYSATSILPSFRSATSILLSFYSAILPCFHTSILPFQPHALYCACARMH